MANRWQTARAAADEANRRRLELLRRLETMLEDRGFVPWNERRARPDDPVEIKLTVEDLAEVCGALNEASQSFALRDELHRHRAYVRNLAEALHGARNSDRAEVLRRFGLVHSKADHALRERLELVRFYWGLISGQGPIESPRRRAAFDAISPSPRPFGALVAWDDGSGLAGRTYPAPIPVVEAVRVVQDELGCPTLDAARERLLAARDAVRQARAEGFLLPSYDSGAGPPWDPPDDFPIPDPAKLAKL